MKMKLSIPVFASIGLVLGSMAGCGGGSSSSPPSDGGDISTLVNLTPEATEDLATRASDALPGCTYNSGTAVAARSNEVVVKLYRGVVKQVLSDSKERRGLSARELSAIVTNDTTTPGTCPTLPGEFTLFSEHDDGVTDTTYTFNSYCIGDAEASTTINGVLTTKEVGEPSPTGPIPQYLTLATGDSGIQVAEKSPEGTFNHEFRVDNLKFTFGNGEGEPTADKPNVLTIGSLSAHDGRDNQEFRVANVNISQYASGTNTVVTITGLTYTDPQSGDVNITTTALVIDENGILIEGAVTASGSDGSSITLNPSETVDNSFDVVVGGETIGVMDCSGLTADALL